jgi:epimerase transport system membrane fusion protein
MKFLEQIPAESATGHRDMPEYAFGASLVPAGFVIIILFFAGFAAWSALAPLESAVVSPGVVSVDSNRKTVQHLEGGIVADIAVRDGDAVRAGDVLMRLRDTEQLSQRNLLSARLDEALASAARLRAERVDAASIDFPAALSERASEPAVAAVLESQRSIFVSRSQLHAEQIGVLVRRQAGFREEITGLEGQIAAAGRQLELITEELGMLEQMDAKKLIGKPQLLALQRERAEIDGAIGEHQAAVARAKQGILESQLRIAELSAARRKDIDEALGAAQSLIQESRQQLTAAQDRLDRSRIRSPIDGTVVGLKVHTVGGVVGPGEPIMEVVPSREELVVQAVVDPRDIEQVQVGLPAHVYLLAYNRRVRTPIEGAVRTLSADALTDPLSGATYYQARVKLDAASLREQPVALHPGMTAEVMIRTGARTPLDYLLEPVTHSLGRALREQ